MISSKNVFLWITVLLFLTYFTCLVESQYEEEQPFFLENKVHSMGNLGYKYRSGPSRNRKDGVMVEGFHSTMLIVNVISSSVYDPYEPIAYHMLKAPLYTKSYRWVVRHFDLWSHFLARQGVYPNTHQLHANRYLYNDRKIPDFVKSLLFFVNKKSWEEEELDERLFAPIAKKFLDPPRDPRG